MTYSSQQFFFYKQNKLFGNIPRLYTDCREICKQKPYFRKGRSISDRRKPQECNQIERLRLNCQYSHSSSTTRPCVCMGTTDQWNYLRGQGLAGQLCLLFPSGRFFQRSPCTPDWLTKTKQSFENLVPINENGRLCTSRAAYTLQAIPIDINGNADGQLFPGFIITWT